MTAIFARGNVPPELERAWLQHLRDFDVANPGCHFEVIADAPEATLSEIIEMMRITPSLPVVEVIARTVPTKEHLVQRIIAMLPDDKLGGLEVLDAARRMVERFKR